MQDLPTQGTMLVVDDMEMNREILSACFEDEFAIMEAENGKEALEILQVCKGFIDVIVLDLSMPEMSGKEFLEYRKKDEEIFNIPVVVVTASKAASDELEVFALGIDDYIVKPFMPEVVKNRIQRVINNKKSFSAILQEKNSFQMQAEMDAMTGLYNKATTENLVGEALKNPCGQLYAFLLLDIDKFKKVNDTEGHMEGDEVIREMAALIGEQFRKTDIVGRLGGDEFVVLMRDIPSKEVARRMAQKLVRLMKYKPQMNMPSYISLSIGLAFNEKQEANYQEVFEKADSALYKAKNNGRNQYQEFGREKLETQDNESILVFNASRTDLSVIEDAAGEKLRLVETSDFRQLKEVLQTEAQYAKVLFVDISDEQDDGHSLWKFIQDSWENITIPVIGIYQDGNMKQCRLLLQSDVYDIAASPFDAMAMKRKLEKILCRE